jgi:hypothetical protein
MFFSLVEYHVVAQIVDFGPKVLAQRWAKFDRNKYESGNIASKLYSSVTRLSLSMIYDFWTASNAIVANDESDK